MALPPSPEVLARRIRRWEQSPETEITPTAQLGRRFLAGETLEPYMAEEYGVTGGVLSMVVRDMKRAGYGFRMTRGQRGGNSKAFTLTRRPAVDFDLELEPRPEEPRRISPGELGVAASRPSPHREERATVTWGSLNQITREVHHRGPRDFERAGWREEAPMETRGTVGEWQHPPLGSNLEVRALALTDEGVLVQMTGAGGVWQAVITGHVE